ncbi:chromate transporter [Aneurinibacillus aneurinilyticus]|jgi:chromate transporter|uniref:Chromate transporter n=2 Tax=Aneurinibacillus aneurinilyticus TaxID=1391 RepID=A0A848D247_ANEAE|nr:chromate transporter [Aneurinibacillus aneurinilyticus]ERI09941.1 chromate transport protein [Aneurinibacillus aneurinilyticus ATCC 12856]MCI1696573.1 chromate transporter [Aneurinibacillus aneurinilyticus]MED0669619.1 chromate transporter [Aneurinibacillus aneurinilyticus]MED0707184.1 chromate transporter [Aneurinibacillus aneurinilyticus]MED0723950.1 chromate transporter [Aneurinibacillus aneurinilyticus]
MTLVNLWNLFWGFFVANILGYGGGPASIPLMQEEIVNHYDWQTTEQFGDMLAVGNALPGPIATKFAAFVGYQEAGWLGMLITTIATVAPSSIALIVLLKILNRYRNSPIVKGMTLLVQPVIAVMLLLLTYDMGFVSYEAIGILQSVGIAAIAWLCMTKFKLHPAIVIVLAFAYGGFILPYVMT